MLFASTALLLSSYVLPSVATSSTTVEQIGLTYGETMEEMFVTFASFSELDENAECLYGPDANNLR